MKKIITLVYACIACLNCFAQDFTSGATMDELNLRKYSKDSAANAVVLNEFGNAYIRNDEKANLIVVHHVKIKIFNSKAFDKGNIIIPIYKEDNERFETVRDIKGSTWYTDDSGNVVESKLDKKKIYTEKKNKYWDHVKFAMPNLRDGCVIEYKYELESPFIFNFRTWEFQSDIPKVQSLFIAKIPGVYDYNVILRGYQKLNSNKADLIKECFTPGGGFKSDCSNISYGMVNVPAFIEEDYMTAPANFRSALYFELAEYTDYRGVKHKVTQDWATIDYDLKKSNMFGDQIKRKDLFKERLSNILADKTDELTKAKQIYSYVQKWFKWNNFYSKYSDDGIKKALESRSGSVGDINLALIAALSAANLHTEAVILSTRENGLINKLYPVVSDFNYVVAKVTVGDKSYLLDATDPLLPFGILPVRCLNDQGRVVSLDKPSYWMDLVAPQKESRIHHLDLTLQEDGKITGKIVRYSSGYEAYNQRSRIKKFNTAGEYVENLDEQMPKTRILKSAIENLDSLNITLKETYDVEIEAFDNLNKDLVYLNPFLMEKFTTNPFKLIERNYPVDWGVPSDSKMIILLKFPEKFEVTAKPETVSLGLPDNGGRYLLALNNEGNTITLNQVIQFNKSVYQPAEYPSIKELYNKIIQSHKSDIVFKRK